jgi:predicted alpha/beta superfamily hydrolase
MIDPVPSSGVGVMVNHADFPSRHIPPRHVDVWCPPGYSSSAHVRYPVVYIHDGQNLFDPSLSYTGVDWGVDEAITRLMAEHRIPGAIVVGIWNTAERRREYMPQKPLEFPRAKAVLARFVHENGGEPVSDAYLRFLVEELKPFVNGAYRTLPERESTFIMGSSMGGLVSLYALCEYPEVFAGAGCLSTHWPIGEDVLAAYVKSALPIPGSHRLYFDYGTETLDSEYEPYQQRMDALIRAAGYVPGNGWTTRKFPGAEHSEAAWRERVHIPLEFLLTGAVSRSGKST